MTTTNTSDLCVVKWDETISSVLSSFGYKHEWHFGAYLPSCFTLSIRLSVILLKRSPRRQPHNDYITATFGFFPCTLSLSYWHSNPIQASKRSLNEGGIQVFTKFSKAASSAWPICSVVPERWRYPHIWAPLWVSGHTISIRHRIVKRPPKERPLKRTRSILRSYWK